MIATAYDSDCASRRDPIPSRRDAIPSAMIPAVRPRYNNRSLVCRKEGGMSMMKSGEEWSGS